MCGIVGSMIWRETRPDSNALRAALYEMRHRGPDDEGITLIKPDSGFRIDLATKDTMADVVLRHPDSDADPSPHTIALGHRRFALVDPGPQSHQPFWSKDGTCCVTWNGEIYNYVELREKLEGLGRRFFTRSDTEVLLAAYQEWGTGCFEQFIGFWALALFDAEKRSVLLARDRIGKAPLYIYSTSSGMYWASEIRALRSIVPSPDWTVREQSAADFLRWGIRDIAGSTFFNEVHTFPSASYVWVREAAMEPVSFWRLADERLGLNDISPDEAAEVVRTTLMDAVRIRLRADVPVGVQVSGGLDSSSILALTAGLTDRVDAYTVSFPNPEANEEPYARAVAEMYGSTVDYHVLSPPLTDPLERLGDFVGLMGEPFHSPNQLTNHAIWEAIRSHGLRGVLYGAGGDEVFLGYPGQYAHPNIRWLIRRGRLLSALREFRRFPTRYSKSTLKDWVVRGLLTAYPPTEGWIQRRSLPPQIDPCYSFRERVPMSRPPSELEARQRANMDTWLIPYWTRIDNQNSMGVPVELRCPFLDHRVVELGFRLPVEYFIQDGWTKWILRVALNDDLPESVAWRREKMGFPFPLSDWLGQSRSHLMSALADLDCPFVDFESLRDNYERLRQVDPNYLWNVLSLSLWWATTTSEC
jgi:asparagine synthase (glutamine-hydrolysing)